MSALHFSEVLPGRSKSLESSRCHGREVLARLVNDRIVSDKTFWNATISRSLFKIVHQVSLSKCNKPFEQSESTALGTIATHATGCSALAWSDSRRDSADTNYFREGTLRKTLPCYLRGSARRCFCMRRSLLRRPLGRGPIGRTPHC